MGGGASVPHPSGVAVWQEDVAQLDFEMERNLSMLDRIGERIAALERKAALLPPEHRALYAVQAARNYAEHCAAAEAERITGGMRPTDKQAREKQRQAEMKRRERQAAYLKRQKIARSAARRAALQDLPALESVAKGSEDERAAQEKREEKRLARQKAAQERREYREQNPNWVEELREKREQEKALRKQRMKAKKLMAEQFSGPFGNLDGRSILEKYVAIIVFVAASNGPAHAAPSNPCGMRVHDRSPSVNVWLAGSMPTTTVSWTRKSKRTSPWPSEMSTRMRFWQGWSRLMRMVTEK